MKSMTKKLLLLGLFFYSAFYSLANFAESTYEYKKEFEIFKNSPRYEAVFNEDAPRILSNLQAMIETDKQLSWFQRFVRSIFFRFQPVAISIKTMPKLYAYIDTICEKHNITTPTIFITRDITFKRGMFNAAAQKLLMSSGAIVIGQKIILEVDDAALEAVVAHELGHIKYNHINKGLLTICLAEIATVLATIRLHDKAFGKDFSNQLPITIAPYLGAFLGQCVIGKRFEKQADEFAYKVMGKTDGCIEFFEDVKNRIKNYDDYFDKTYDILQESKRYLGLIDRFGLTFCYYCASFGHKIDLIARWLSYNTPIGSHPSPDARIKAVKDYLARQQSAA